MHALGRLAYASHALLPAAAAFPAAAAPILAAWGAVQAAAAWHLLNPRSSRLAANVRRAGTDAARVALTYDDGPRPGETERLLDALAASGASATFFVVGRRARARPDLLRRIAAAGHAVGNHTDTHPLHWSVLPRRRVLAEVGGAQSALAEILGEAPRWFRPPVGHKSFHLAEALEAHGLVQVTWSVRSLDTVIRDPRRVARRVLDRARGGDIVLLHEGLAGADGTPVSVGAAGPLLEGLARGGIAPVSLQALLSTPRAPTAPPAAPGRPS
jgi:peptidoglycan/xylan/chitin deacetylase (PgdA/CDA1 family)